MADNNTPTPAPTPAPVVPDNHSVIQNDLQNALADLAHKHVTISYTLVGLIVLILALCCAGAYFGNQSWQKAMDRAQAIEQEMNADRAQYQQTLAAMQKQIDQNNAQIQADQVRQQQLIDQINKRDQQANKVITDVLQPGKTATDAFSDINAAYKGIVALTQDIVKDPNSNDQLLAFPVPAVQQFTAAELAEQRDSKDLADTKGQLAAEQDKTAKLTDNLNKTNDTLASLQKTDAVCQQTVAAYKKVAKKTRWQKIWGGIKKGAEIGGSLVLGYEIGHHL